jgi:hypothetical protein
MAVPENLASKDTTATAPPPNGAAIAAYLSAMIGLLTLGIVVFASEASKPFAQTVHTIGKLWMPGAEGIGPYSGKETLGLVTWLISWLVLHFSLRNRQMSGGLWLIVFLLGIGLATTLVWPPIWHFFLGGH